jgi:hypothetical protein
LSILAANRLRDYLSYSGAAGTAIGTSRDAPTLVAIALAVGVPNGLACAVISYFFKRVSAK